MRPGSSSSLAFYPSAGIASCRFEVEDFARNVSEIDSLCVEKRVAGSGMDIRCGHRQGLSS